MKRFIYSIIPLLALHVAVTPVSAQETDSTMNSEKEKITLHITREENGKTIVFDTTFEKQGHFDVDQFLQDKGFGDLGSGFSRKYPNNKFELRIPSPEDGFRFNFDSILPGPEIFGDNFRLFRDKPGYYRFEWKDMPDFRFDFRFPEQDDSSGFNDSKIPPSLLLPPKMNDDRGLPHELDKLLSGHDIEKMKIKNYRHGKKIVIKTRKNPDPLRIGPNSPGMQEERYIYFGDSPSRDYGKHTHKRIIIRKHAPSQGEKSIKEERRVIIEKP